MYEIIFGRCGDRAGTRTGPVKDVRYARIVAGQARNKIGPDAWSIVRNLQDGTEIRMGKFRDDAARTES